MHASMPIDQQQWCAALCLAAEAGADSGALRIFAAMLVLSMLALAATSKSFYRFQRHRLTARYLSGGWLAVLIGFLLGRWGANVVTEDMLLEVRPALTFGLGWIGAIIGLQARGALMRAVPANVRRWVLFDSLVAIILIGGLSALVLAFFLVHTAPAWWVAPIGLLITAGIGWAAETRSLGEERKASGMHLAVLVQAGAGLAAMTAVALHGLLILIPTRNNIGELGFSLSTSALRLLATVLLASTMGIIGRFLLQQAGRERREMFVVYIAMIALMSGIASELGVSPLFAAMICGVVITNLGGPKLREFDRFVLRAEQTVAILFALLAGVFVDPRIGVWGWLLVAALVLSRLAVKSPLMRWSLRGQRTALPAASPLYLAPMRQSLVAVALGVAVVVDEPSPFNQELLTVVLLVGALSELLPFAFSWWRGESSTAPSPRPEAAGAPS
ncbi:MAG: hypothetical protein IT430_13965 [Phycisphaerales bacterium]|nr:hypothetical protein [Phycisphaerales bacterium]